MKIDEAIAILQHIQLAKLHYFLYHEQQALELGIEALECIQSKRITMSYHPGDLLPRENKR